MKCTDCQASIETNGLWRQFNAPQCPYCTARLIKAIASLATPSKAEIVVRQRAQLADAVVYGHSETDVRNLVKIGPYVQPPIEILTTTRKRK